MTIYGEGSLTATGNYKDGISTDDGLLIKSGTINIASANGDAINAQSDITINDCVFDIISGKIT
jgi:hypothetical protein